MKKSDIKNVKKGDFYSRVSYGTVESASWNGINITNEAGNSWSVEKSIVEDEFYFHDQFTETVSVTRTQLAEIFMQNSNVIMTVNYNKQVKEGDVLDRIEKELYANEGGVIISKAEFNKRAKTIVKDTLTGENRTMIGRHYGSVNEFGRMPFIDMEQERDTSKEYDTRTRQVDPRTLQWLIVKGVKFTSK